MEQAVASAGVDSLPTVFLFMINSEYLGKWGRVGREAALAPETQNNN